MRVVRSLWALCLFPLLGCTAEIDEPTAEVSDAVLGGQASSRTAVVLIDTANVRCGGIAVGPRTVVAVDLCATNDARIVPTPTMSTPVDVINIIQGPTVNIPNDTVGFAVYEVGSDLPVDPAAIGPAPAVGATLTLAGYGSPNGVDIRTEGEITVDSVATQTFIATGVEACVSDAGAFDAQDRLVGIGYYGEFTVNGCRDPISYFNAEELAALVGQNVGGSGGGGGATSGGGGFGMGGGATASVTTSSGVGGGATTGGGRVLDEGNDVGCGCRVAGRDDSTEGALTALLLLGLASARRRLS